jgi:hypothetical protein
VSRLWRLPCRCEPLPSQPSREGSRQSHAPESYLEQYEADTRIPGTDGSRRRARIDVESASIAGGTRRCGPRSPGVKPAGNIGRSTTPGTMHGRRNGLCTGGADKAAVQHNRGP